MTDESRTRAPTQRGGIRLSKASRTVAFALGIAGLGAGGAAVYLTHLEAGPVGLMAVGLIFMIIALGGILPTRLKIGEGEAEWQVAVGGILETAVEAAPPAARAELIDRLNDLAVIAPAAAAPALSGLAYEELIADLIQEIIFQDDALEMSSETIVYQPPPRVSSGFDLTIVVADNRALLIEIKAAIKLSTGLIAEIASKAQDYRERSGRRAAVLLITRFRLPSHGRALLAEIPNASYVVVDGRKDRKLLTNAMNNALSTLGE